MYITCTQQTFPNALHLHRTVGTVTFSFSHNAIFYIYLPQRCGIIKIAAVKEQLCKMQIISKMARYPIIFRLFGKVQCMPLYCTCTYVVRCSHASCKRINNANIYSAYDGNAEREIEGRVQEGACHQHCLNIVLMSNK